MTQHLILYWQRLTRRPDHDKAADAPVLDLAACFANPVIAARRPTDLAVRPVDGMTLRAISG